MNVIQAIRYANSILPGVPALEGENDPRWQAIINVGEFIQSNPEEVWSFIARWGIHEDEDLRSAISTCLLEHILQCHFELVFHRVESLAKKSSLFASTLSTCWISEKDLSSEQLQRFIFLKSVLAT
jgi:hypothetical protein